MSTTSPQAPRHGQAHWLGEGIDYAWAWGLQRDLLEERVAGERQDTLLLMGHAPVYTAGRRSVPEDVLAQLPAPLVETDRGGQTTYHGPGQLVGYPIVSLTELGLGPKRYVEAVESALIAALAEYGVAAHREEGLTGVWTRSGKIAAIGVKVSRGVTMHGFALNVATDLRAYEVIVPCGIGDRPVTSLAALVGSAPDLKEAAYVAAKALGASLGISWQVG
ncbi:MAG: lipoyl(octanoyl) transferase LipB [Chloroflexota bacterium]|nr:lipoyl(octanoyl) transferase LipB [Chloroflexota bacterium]MDE2883636.1 lipoyl(octanoyl) transferase LipB [Chloroflexota bacterium]